jgi:hypothetical protein
MDEGRTWTEPARMCTDTCRTLRDINQGRFWKIFVHTTGAVKFPLKQRKKAEKTVFACEKTNLTHVVRSQQYLEVKNALLWTYSRKEQYSSRNSLRSWCGLCWCMFLGNAQMLQPSVLVCLNFRPHQNSRAPVSFYSNSCYGFTSLAAHNTVLPQVLGESSQVSHSWFSAGLWMTSQGQPHNTLLQTYVFAKL